MTRDVVTGEAVRVRSEVVMCTHETMGALYEFGGNVHAYRKIPCPSLPLLLQTSTPLLCSSKWALGEALPDLSPHTSSSLPRTQSVSVSHPLWLEEHL